MGPLAAMAQPPVKVPRIGVILTQGIPGPSCSLHYFVVGLQELGYVEGQTINIEWRCAEGRDDRAREFAGELVRLGVNIIVTSSLAPSQAAKAATSTIPIIFGGGGDPVAGGLVASLARPGGNVTGVSNLVDNAFFAKQLELLREVVPHVRRVALLLYRHSAFNADLSNPVVEAARTVGIDVQLVEVEGPHDFEAAFAAMTRQGVGAFLVSASPFLATYRAQIADLAVKNGLPAIASRSFAEHGLLMAYNSSPADRWRRVASYVDRILKGAKPADLPVEMPMKYELVINLKIAKALGLTIPQTLLILADEVIQ
jgi:putative ABC transport system substrate-binding protein